MWKRADSHTMEKQLLRPSKEEINVQGRMFYDSSIRAWNTLRLKTEMLREFKSLKDRSSKFSYKLSFYEDYLTFEKALRKMKKANLPLPVLMWFVKEN